MERGYEKTQVTVKMIKGVLVVKVLGNGSSLSTDCRLCDVL